MELKSGKESVVAETKGSGTAWSKDGKRLLARIRGSLLIISIDSMNVKQINCQVRMVSGTLAWSADEKTAVYLSGNCIEKIRIVEGATFEIVHCSSKEP